MNNFMKKNTVFRNRNSLRLKTKQNFFFNNKIKSIYFNDLVFFFVVF